MKKGIIILGSSNSKGNTARLAAYVSEKTNFPIVDLKTKDIGEFDYEFKNSDDDFLPLIKDIADNYDLIVFATPIYWYTMSGIMKTFFDRISDCLKIDKETGRKLRGKEMAVISCSSDDDYPKGYYMPFVESAKYLGMSYIANVHGWLENDQIPKSISNRLDGFIENVR